MVKVWWKRIKKYRNRRKKKNIEENGKKEKEMEKEYRNIRMEIYTKVSLEMIEEKDKGYINTKMEKVYVEYGKADSWYKNCENN